MALGNIRLKIGGYIVNTLKKLLTFIVVASISASTVFASKVPHQEEKPNQVSHLDLHFFIKPSHEKNCNDAVLNDLKNHLISDVKPILLNNNLFYLLMHAIAKDKDYSPIHSGSRDTVRSVIHNWTLYRFKDSLLYIFIPAAYWKNKKKHVIKKVFNTKRFLSPRLIPHDLFTQTIKQKPLTSSFIEKFAQLFTKNNAHLAHEKLFEDLLPLTLPTIFTPHINTLLDIKINMCITGHGSPYENACGLSLSEMRYFLYKLNQLKPINAILLTTCYAYTNKEYLKENDLNFLLCFFGISNEWIPERHENQIKRQNFFFSFARNANKIKDFDLKQVSKKLALPENNSCLHEDYYFIPHFLVPKTNEFDLFFKNPCFMKLSTSQENPITIDHNVKTIFTNNHLATPLKIIPKKGGKYRYGPRKHNLLNYMLPEQVVDSFDRISRHAGIQKNNPNIKIPGYGVSIYPSRFFPKYPQKKLEFNNQILLSPAEEKYPTTYGQTFGRGVIGFLCKTFILYKDETTEQKAEPYSSVFIKELYGFNDLLPLLKITKKPLFRSFLQAMKKKKRNEIFISEDLLYPDQLKQQEIKKILYQTKKHYTILGSPLEKELKNFEHHDITLSNVLLTMKHNGIKAIKITIAFDFAGTRWEYNPETATYPWEFTEKGTS